MKNTILQNILFFILISLSISVTADNATCDSSGNCSGTYPNSTTSSSLVTASQQQNTAASSPDGHSSASYAASMAAKAAAEKQGCLDAATSLGTQCNAAYAQLGRICTSFNVLAGGLIGATGKLFYSKIMSSALDPSVASMITMGGGVMGFASSDIIVPCTDLTSQATAYCAAGVARFKDNCPK